MPEPQRGTLESLSPSAVGLTRLSARLSFSSGGEALYRSLLRLVSLSPDSEFLLVPSGRGRGATFVAETTGAAGAGADPDEEMVAVASGRARNHGLSSRLHFEHAPLDDLPYQDDVFDLALGEVELAAAQDPAGVVRELVRVTRPGGTVVLIQLVWLRPLEEERRVGLVQRLGIRPLMLVEWKQILKDAGVLDVQVDDWSDAASSPRRVPVLGGLAELFTVRGKARILPRAWRRWGWRGVRAVLAREQELRRLLQDERVLGVAVLRGRVKMDNDDEENRAELDQ